jgi:hypothetical protein
VIPGFEGPAEGARPAANSDVAGIHAPWAPRRGKGNVYIGQFRVAKMHHRAEKSAAVDI